MTQKPSYRVNPEPVHLRADGNEEKSIGGYAAKFNIDTNLGWMTESIAPGAFDDVLGDDVRCLFNHDPNQVIGRTKSGTLVIEQDETGLRYDNKMSMTSPIALHVMDAVQRKDVSQSSFAFSIGEESWEKRKSGEGFDYWHRTIMKCQRLYDVSPVTYPAYDDATVEELSASLDSFVQREMPEEIQGIKELRRKFYKEEIQSLVEQQEMASEHARKVMGMRMRYLSLMINK